MIEIQCRDCKRITEYEELSFNYDITCRECGGYFDKVEDESEDYDDDEDDDCESEEETTHTEPIVNLPNLEEEVSIEKFDPEAKTRFD